MKSLHALLTSIVESKVLSTIKRSLIIIKDESSLLVFTEGDKGCAVFNFKISKLNKIHPLKKKLNTTLIDYIYSIIDVYSSS